MTFSLPLPLKLWSCKCKAPATPHCRPSTELKPQEIRFPYIYILRRAEGVSLVGQGIILRKPVTYCMSRGYVSILYMHFLMRCFVTKWKLGVSHSAWHAPKTRSNSTIQNLFVMLRAAYCANAHGSQELIIPTASPLPRNRAIKWASMSTEHLWID
jgi:hypothetical protein